MKVLVVAAHPDDEVLGVGGTVIRHVQAGDSVAAVIVGEGATSRGPDGAVSVKALRQCAVAAASKLGCEPPTLLGFPDNRLDEVGLLDIVKSLEYEIQRVNPEIIYTHYRGDLNIDHRIVHDAVLTAARPIPGCSVKSIYCFETPSSTEWGLATFSPKRYVDITSELDRKLRALDLYDSEMRMFPHPRSLEAVEALARVRGAASGLVAAEAFEVVREVWPVTSPVKSD